MRRVLVALLVAGAVSGAAVSASNAPPSRSTDRSPFRSGVRSAAFGHAAIAAAGETVLLEHRTKTSGCKLGARPDRRCSPGAYYSGLTKKVICSASFRTGDYRHVTTSEKHAVEVEYGLAVKSYGSALEIDHIISLELGGSNDIANLFPETLFAHPGYRIKDKLENRVHDLVCDGRISLRRVRQEIASDWEALYTKAFGAPAVG